MAAGVAKVLAHRAAAVWRDKLQRGRFRSGRGDHRGVFHRTMAVELVDHLGDGRAFLPDRDVEALHVLAALVDDCVERDRGLAGLAVADDQLALAAPDLQHRVDRLDSGLERFLDRLTANDPRSFNLDPPLLGGLDWSLAIDRLAQRIDHPAEQSFADRDLGDAVGALDFVALANRLRIAEQRRADVVLLEVEHYAEDPMRELQQFAQGRVLQSVDARNTVAA